MESIFTKKFNCKYFFKIISLLILLNFNNDLSAFTSVSTGSVEDAFDKAATLIDKGNYDEANKILESIYSEKSYLASDSILLGKVLANIGTINSRLGLYDKAIAYYLKAEEKYNRLGEKELIRLTSVQVNLALCYLKCGDMGKSLLHYENSDRIFQKLKMKEAPQYESLLNNNLLLYHTDLAGN
jgi:tetratricopeptide (TPR) repeat protein